MPQRGGLPDISLDPYQNQTRYSHSPTNNTLYQQQAARLDKDFGEKIRNKVSLKNLPNAIHSHHPELSAVLGAQEAATGGGHSKSQRTLLTEYNQKNNYDYRKHKSLAGGASPDRYQKKGSVILKSVT